MPFYVAAAGQSDIWGALGINWWSLLANALAFLIVAWVLGRYVYPALVKALDDKADQYASASTLKSQAEQALSQAESQAQKILQDARKSAQSTTDAARDEARTMLVEAERKASLEAERIVAAAHQEVERDTQAARRQLKAETARLVATATAKLLGERLNRDSDMALIGRSLEDKS